ncbi:sigma-54 dependent transcriptional regulator [Planktotalea arctica]|uniref:sigma-54 dependent transcriptional regulator n=1 Tax=Planktotalea arctica TaxID=1481893 RepID=UPI00321910F7
MQRVVIDMVEFKTAEAVLSALQEHRVAVVSAASFQSSQRRAGTDFFVLSQARANALGGQSGIIEAARECGARTVLVVDETAQEYAVTTELSGKIAHLALGQSMPRDYAVLCLVALLHGTGRALVRDAGVAKLFEMSARVAQADVSVFINGPTGSGKEVMAKYIHQRSRRSEGEFVAINCAAIPENMLEAMLFGHEKGAFTGASTANVGLIRAADGGTLLLDEISEMSMPLQAKLLRAIQELAVTPVGSNRQISVDIRILATSNRNMQQECSAGRFREDLFYRLNVFPITTMALSERRADILPIALEFLVRHARDVSEIAYLAPCAIEVLEQYDWPGNIRELENVIQRALVLKTGATITRDAIMIDQFSSTLSFPDPQGITPNTAHSV